MLYLKFTDKTNFNKEKWTIGDFLLYKILSFFIPRANPDFENKFNLVVEWYIEYDDINNYTNREIGIDNKGKAITKAPYKKNLGLWTDSDLKIKDFQKFNPEIIQDSEFNEFWDML